MSSFAGNKRSELLTEVTEEKRLLIELLFAIKVLDDFKAFLDSINDKLHSNLDTNQLKIFEDLYQRMVDVIDDNQTKLNKELADNCQTDDNNGEDRGVSETSAEDKTPITTRRKVLTPKKCFNKNENRSQENKESTAAKTLHQKKVANKHVCIYPGCRFTTAAMSVLQDHINVHTGNRPYVCPICMKTFAKRNILRKHDLHIHQNLGKNHVCDYPGCEFRSSMASKLSDHKNIHTGHRPYECSDCDKTFKSKVSLQMHFRAVHKLSDQLLVCDIDNCGKQFKTEFSFAKHQKECHLCEKTFVCQHPDCHFRAPNRARLGIHMIKHSDDRPFTCTVDGCPQTFKTLASVRIHTQTHSSERPHACTQEGCGKRFKTYGDLRKHTVLCHSQQKKHRCEWPGCEYTAALKQMVTNHQLVHTSLDESDIVCQWPQCGKRFKMKSKLAMHMRIHTNDKRHVCHWPGCQYRCVTSGNLKKHLAIHGKSGDQ